MSLNASQYIDRSSELLSAGRQLLISLDSGGTRPPEVAAVEEATKQPAATELGYAASPSILEDEELSHDDELRALLLDFQSANLLIAAGLATEGPKTTSEHLSQAVSQLEATQAEMTTSSSLQLEFAAGSTVNSADLNSAKQTFQSDSEFTLSQIVSETENVVMAVLEQLKKLNGSKVNEALDSIGKSFKMAADVGRLVKKGIEKLKSTLQSLFDLLGQAGLGAAKERATKIWNKFTKGEYSKELLNWLFGVKDTKDRIEARFKRDDPAVDKVDIASNELRPLSEDYSKKMKILKGLVGVLTLITAAVGIFHVTVPWLPVALGAAYLTLMGAAIVMGMNYAGVSNALPWVTGVREIADRI